MPTSEACVSIARSKFSQAWSLGLLLPPLSPSGARVKMTHLSGPQSGLLFIGVVEQKAGEKEEEEEEESSSCLHTGLLTLHLARASTDAPD